MDNKLAFQKLSFSLFITAWRREVQQSGERMERNSWVRQKVVVGLRKQYIKMQKEVTEHTLRFLRFGFPLCATYLRPLFHDSPKLGCWQWWCYRHLGHPQTSLSGTQSSWCCMQTPSSHLQPCWRCPYICTPWANMRECNVFFQLSKIFLLLKSNMKSVNECNFITELFPVNTTSVWGEVTQTVIG